MNDMNDLISLTFRNVKVFLRDKMSVFFSFFSVIIIIGLYAIFLGKMQADSIIEKVGNPDGVRFMVDSWIIAGIVVVNSITTCLGSLGVMVKDVQNKTISDFISSPMSRVKILVSYLLSSIIIAFILTTISLILGELYIVLNGGELLSFIQFIKTFIIVIVSVVGFSSVLFFITTFIKTQNAFGGLSTIVGTFVGFFMGIYIPIGVLGVGMQKVISFFIPSHMGVALRQVFMEKSLDIVFSGAPIDAINEYNSAIVAVLLIGILLIFYLYLD